MSMEASPLEDRRVPYSLITEWVREWERPEVEEVKLGACGFCGMHYRVNPVVQDGSLFARSLLMESDRG